MHFSLFRSAAYYKAIIAFLQCCAKIVFLSIFFNRSNDAGGWKKENCIATDRQTDRQRAVEYMRGLKWTASSIIVQWTSRGCLSLSLFFKHTQDSPASLCHRDPFSIPPYMHTQRGSSLQFRTGWVYMEYRVMLWEIRDFSLVFFFPNRGLQLFHAPVTHSQTSQPLPLRTFIHLYLTSQIYSLNTGILNHSAAAWTNKMGTSIFVVWSSVIKCLHLKLAF